MNLFDNGYLRILVVTSVAEEGLNIATCNLIVKYNSVGSERTLIQRRGRARAKDSKAILLALDLDVQSREYSNMIRENLMHTIIKDLQAHPENELKKMVKKF